MKNDSSIFALNRVLGYVSNEVPLQTRYIKKRKENLIVTCVDKSFYTWSSDRFTLLSVSPLQEHPIHCLASDSFLIFTASATSIRAWRRGVELKQTYISSSKSRIHLILPFGPHLIGIDETNVLTIWDIKNEDIYLELQLPVESFQVTAICHPPSYINKILLACKQGEMRLYNVNSSALIYSFTGWNSSITVLTPSLALDIVAVGLHNGKIILHNIKFDETVATFIQDWGPVTCLSFRTDGQPVMASASIFGHIVFWDLEKRNVISQHLNAHDARITGMQYLPNEPLLVTSSPDNSLKLWIFDKPDGSARLLRIRAGHSSSPALIRFYGMNGEHILSTGPDCYLRAFNTTTEIANKNFGRAIYRINGKKIAVRRTIDDVTKASDYKVKMPAIEQFSTQLIREKEWDNIAAIHTGTAIISTWSFPKSRFGTTLVNNHLKKKYKTAGSLCASSVFLTHCGNFIIVGYKSGEVDKFNIQSGLFKGSFGNPKAHNGSVNGVYTNDVNRILITGSSDHFIRFWSFKQINRKYLHQLDVGDSITFMRNSPDSSLIAVALGDYSVFILDIDYKAVIRKFASHFAELTDCTFSPDGRWLVSASMDSTIQTWDIPTGKCIDCFEVDRPCVTLTFCPTSMYLATAHVDQLGVTLWFNRSTFSFASISSVKINSLQNVDNLINVSVQNSLVTLATNCENCPAANRWQTILQVDSIRERNSAKKVVKKQEVAPFILPLIPAVNIKFDLSIAAKNKENTENRTVNPYKFERLTNFATSLLKSSNTTEYEAAGVKLKSLGPSLVNFEIVSLSPEEGGSIELMSQFIRMLQVMLTSRKHFEISSSYLALFLKTYSTFVLDYPMLYDNLRSVFNLHKDTWLKLQNQFIYCISVSKFLKNN